MRDCEVKLADGCKLPSPDFDLMRRMLDFSHVTRLTVKDAFDLLENLVHKEIKEKPRQVVPVKGSFELGSHTLDEKRQQRGGDFNAYQFRGFSNKFIPADDTIHPQTLTHYGNTMAFTDTIKESRLEKITKTETTRIEIEDFHNDQIDEDLPKGIVAKEGLGNRHMVYKTLSNLKSKSTFVEGSSNHLKGGHANASLIFGNESTLRVHKGSSDIFHGLTPSSKTSMER